MHQDLIQKTEEILEQIPKMEKKNQALDSF